MQITTNNEWFEATVSAITVESPTVKTFTFSAPHPIYNKAGQHFELRLTAENGYQAARLYSAVHENSGEQTVQLTIMHVKGGEVSPYVSKSLKIGDKVDDPVAMYLNDIATIPVNMAGIGGMSVPCGLAVDWLLCLRDIGRQMGLGPQLVGAGCGCAGRPLASLLGFGQLRVPGTRHR